MTDIGIWRGLDWFRYTVEVTTPKSGLVPGSRPSLDGYKHGKRAFPGYTHMMPLYPVGRVDWHRDKPEQRMLVTLTGQDLQNMRERGITDQQVLDTAYKHMDASFTRIDYAVDIYGSGIDAAQVAADFREGKVQTSARSSSTLQVDTGEGFGLATTLYIGSRSSARFLRVYDKGKEQKTGEDWIRIEIELKKQAAEVFADIASRKGVITAGLNMINDFVQFEDEVISDALSGVGVALPKGKRKTTNRDRWIRDTILPLLERELKQGNETVQSWLIARLQELSLVG